MNLLTNAIQYTPDGGQVRVKLEADLRTAVITGTVIDTGIGITAEEIPRIFEEFYRTGEAKSMQETGTGLGLSIIQQILSLYRGNLEIESVPQQGSTFRFTLPLSEAGDKGVL
jgi:signal transduction histidine kinase